MFGSEKLGNPLAGIVLPGRLPASGVIPSFRAHHKPSGKDLVNVTSAVDKKGSSANSITLVISTQKGAEVTR